MRKPPFSLPFLPDGVSAAQMHDAGMEEGECPALWALEHPDFIRAQTERFRRAGAMALLAPTLTANREILSRFGLAERVREQGRGVIILVPEISLTPQTVELFGRRFGKHVAVLHSGSCPRVFAGPGV